MEMITKKPGFVPKQVANVVKIFECQCAKTRNLLTRIATIERFLGQRREPISKPGLKIPLAIFALAIGLASQLSVAGQERPVFQLDQIDGRTWLITPEGKPFFAHGITHTTNRSLSKDYDAVSKACKNLGFNAYGYGCPPELKKDMPYVEGRNFISTSTYMRNKVRFVDIFDPRVRQKLSAQVKQRCLENRDNPNLIGYYWTDLSAWPLKNSTGKNWVDFIRKLPADAPGRAAYAEFLMTWKAKNANPENDANTKARDLAFLRVIAREYFRVIGEANREHDPDHLIFGDRFAFNTIVPEVLEEMLPWVDAIAIQPPFQPGFPAAKYREIHQLTGKPILICDFAIRFKDGDKSIRGWKLQEDARAAGVEYSKYIRDALETPYIIGAFWCNPVDSKGAFNMSGGLKQGLFADGLTPRPGLGEAVIDLNQHIAKLTPRDGDITKTAGETPSIPNEIAEPTVIGNREFIHLQTDNGIWWLTDHTGKRFITTGMNHIGEGGVLFNEVNQGWLTGKFGEDIKGSWGGLNPRAKNHGAYADMVVKDFKDYSFNTIPFHAYSTPLNYYEERKIYYVAKIKVQGISLMGMNRAKGARFPDVFSKGFRDKLDVLAKKTCTPLRDAKYCLGYAYFDMPDLKPVRRWQKQMFPDGGLVYPWVQDIRMLPAEAAGKQEWIRILKQNHASADAAARVYAISDVTSWDELAKVLSWPIEPNDVPKVKKDADDMLTSLAEKWYGLHKELIRKYDPNHLLLGDKHDVGYDKSVDMIPDGVLGAIGKHCDVLTIQYYTFYTDQHNSTLRELHNKTGLPIINGDHSYSFKTAKHTKLKGLEVGSFAAVANEYQRYLKGSMEDHPYMLGWWYCGYIEQWAPAGTKQLGQQCGFFSPFGEPNEKLLSVIKEANERASIWHGGATANKPPPMVTRSQPNSETKPSSSPSTPAEMFAALKLTVEQQIKLDAIEKERKAAEATFRDLSGEAQHEARNNFYAQRKKKLKRILTNEQWDIWSSFWSRKRNQQ